MKRQLASALIDLSDGLALDLARLCEASGIGARLLADRIPVPCIPEWDTSTGSTLFDLALHGGEDYQLLFAVSAKRAMRVPRQYRGVRLHHIGEAVKGKGIVLASSNGTEVPLLPAGYDHFRKKLVHRPGKAI
jgi:thiamine-monophosphate kinase